MRGFHSISFYYTEKFLDFYFVFRLIVWFLFCGIDWERTMSLEYLSCICCHAAYVIQAVCVSFS
jgi:hypothetical protein